MKKTAKLILTFALSTALIISMVSCSASSQMQAVFLKDGDADCIVITSAEMTMVIDTGESDDADKLTKLLADQNTDKVDALVITHFDKDHVGGAAELITTFIVDKVYVPDYTESSDEYNAFVTACDDTGITPMIVDGSISFGIGSISVAVLSGDSGSYDNDNNYSLMTRIVCGDKNLLFAGDALEARIDEFLLHNTVKYDFLKVPHHGREDDGTYKLVDSVSVAQSAVICANKDDEADYSKVKSYLENRNCTVYVTGDGDVTLTCNGSEIEMQQ